MSGGHFDGREFNIALVADEIEKLINDGEYNETVLNHFESAANALRIAYIMVHRIDWFVSGDDGEETFLNEWNSDLSEYINE
jgi:hypothetical protein